jgi:DNA-binding XRE family transcriptional regulator
MNEMSLKELLDSVGINKSVLAKLMSVSRQTIQRMGDDVSDEVLLVIDKYKDDMTHDQSESVPIPTSKPVPSDNKITGSDILPVTRENIAHSCTWHRTMDKQQVANRFNLSVFKYNQEVQATIKHCKLKATSFIELRA